MSDRSRTAPGRSGLHRGVICLAVGCALIVTEPALASTSLLDARMSPDIGVALSGSGVERAEIADDDLGGNVSAIGFPDLPTGVDVIGYQRLAGGIELLVFDTSFELPGAIVVERGDIMRLENGTYTFELDASAAGIPSSAVVDALARGVGGSLLLSFDTSVDLGAFVADDEDLVRWNGVSFTALEFDASAVGISMALDLDAAHLAANGHLLLSFDGSGDVGGFYFDDEDVLEYDPVAMSWELSLDVSTFHSEWARADLDALSLGTDSDDDALSDRVETNTSVFVDGDDTGSDPLAFDTDGDGYGDGEEVAGGFDPNNSQSNPAPAPPVPGLGGVGFVVLVGTLAMTALSVRRRNSCG